LLYEFKVEKDHAFKFSSGKLFKWKNPGFMISVLNSNAFLSDELVDAPSPPTTKGKKNVSFPREETFAGPAACESLSSLVIGNSGRGSNLS